VRCFRAAAPRGPRSPYPPHRRDGKGQADLRAGLPARRAIQSGCFWLATTPGGRTSSETWCCRKRRSQEGGEESARQEGSRQEGCEEGSGQESSRQEGCEEGSGQESSRQEGCEEGSGQESSRQEGCEEGSGPQGRNQAGSGQEGSGQEGHSPSRPSLDANASNADSPRTRLSSRSAANLRVSKLRWWPARCRCDRRR